MQDIMKSLGDKMKDSGALKQKAAEIQAHQADLVKQFKQSNENTLGNWKEKVDVMKQHHAKLTEKVKQSKQENTKKLTEKMEQAKEHHKAIVDTWQASTQRIMDLMKNTATSHMRNV